MFFVTYSMNCSQGHEPEMISVEAENDDDAMMKMMDTCKAHFAAKHQDMTMSDEEMGNFIKGNWTKA